MIADLLAIGSDHALPRHERPVPGGTIIYCPGDVPLAHRAFNEQSVLIGKYATDADAQSAISALLPPDATSHEPVKRCQHCRSSAHASGVCPVEREAEVLRERARRLREERREDEDHGHEHEPPNHRRIPGFRGGEETARAEWGARVVPAESPSTEGASAPPDGGAAADCEERGSEGHANRRKDGSGPTSEIGGGTDSRREGDNSGAHGGPGVNVTDPTLSDYLSAITRIDGGTGRGASVHDVKTNVWGSAKGMDATRAALLDLSKQGRLRRNGGRYEVNGEVPAPDGSRVLVVEEAILDAGLPTDAEILEAITPVPTLGEALREKLGEKIDARRSCPGDISIGVPEGATPDNLTVRFTGESPCTTKTTIRAEVLGRVYVAEIDTPPPGVTVTLPPPGPDETGVWKEQPEDTPYYDHCEEPEDEPEFTEAEIRANEETAAEWDCTADDGLEDDDDLPEPVACNGDCDECNRETCEDSSTDGHRWYSGKAASCPEVIRAMFTSEDDSDPPVNPEDAPSVRPCPVTGGNCEIADTACMDCVRGAAEPGKLTKNESTPEMRALWDEARACSRQVAEWPDWKRGAPAPDGTEPSTHWVRAVSVIKRERHLHQTRDQRIEELRQAETDLRALTDEARRLLEELVG